MTRYWLRLISLMFVLFFSALANSNVVGFTKTDSVEVRKEFGGKGEIIDTLAKNLMVGFAGEFQGWAFISYVTEGQSKVGYTRIENLHLDENQQQYRPYGQFHISKVHCLHFKNSKNAEACIVPAVVSQVCKKQLRSTLLDSCDVYIKYWVRLKSSVKSDADINVTCTSIAEARNVSNNYVDNFTAKKTDNLKFQYSKNTINQMRLWHQFYLRGNFSEVEKYDIKCEVTSVN